MSEKKKVYCSTCNFLSTVDGSVKEYICHEPSNVRWPEENEDMRWLRGKKEAEYKLPPSVRNRNNDCPFHSGSGIGEI